MGVDADLFLAQKGLGGSCNGLVDPRWILSCKYYLHCMLKSELPHAPIALLAAAKSESSATAAAAAANSSAVPNPLEQFFEVDRSAEDEKPVYGRSWKASELRLKSWDDLHKLWYVLLKEKNMLMTQRQMLHAQNLRFPNPERIPKVRKSMCRIKQVLTERALEDPDPRRLSVLVLESGNVMLP
ncbi:Ribosomal protein L29 [Corchorus capsularis]|uniref:Large ribosomal subunit protein uL29m n=1 Tax=Corchorus capsularis TaxID=210143 RepID=A0A1R3JAL1_COCAP|nr:Ribosomal protein L29 [Corchorus capsularis]